MGHKNLVCFDTVKINWGLVSLFVKLIDKDSRFEENWQTSLTLSLRWLVG